MLADQSTQSTQKQWAQALKRQKNDSKQKKQRAIETQKQELQDALTFHKQKIIEAIDTEQEALLEKHARALLKLRADQIALALQESEVLFGELEETFVQQYIKQYTKDVYRLSAAITNLAT